MASTTQGLAGKQRHKRRQNTRRSYPGLRLVKRLGPFWYVSGTYRGKRIRICTFETDRDRAQQCMRLWMDQVDHEIGVHPRFGAAVRPGAFSNRSPLTSLSPAAMAVPGPLAALPKPHGKRKRTFHEACDGYLNRHRPGDSMRRAVIKVRDFYEPDLLCEDFIQEELDRAFEELGGEGVTDATLKRQILSPVRAVLTWAAQTWGLAQGCARPSFRPMGDGGRRERVVTPAEAESILDRAEDKGLYMLVVAMVLALCEGPRREDLHRLVWEEINLEFGVVTFQDVKFNKDVVRDHRIDDMRPRTLRVLAKLQAMTGATHGPVFRREDGLPFSRVDTFGKAMNDQMRELTKELGLPRVDEITLHMLRHSCASWIYVVDPDIERTRIRMGWTTTKMAFRYVHLLPRHHRTEVLKVWQVDRIDKAG